MLFCKEISLRQTLSFIPVCSKQDNKFIFNMNWNKANLLLIQGTCAVI